MSASAVRVCNTPRRPEIVGFATVSDHRPQNGVVRGPVVREGTRERHLQRNALQSPWLAVWAQGPPDGVQRGSRPRTAGPRGMVHRHRPAGKAQRLPHGSSPRPAASCASQPRRCRGAQTGYRDAGPYRAAAVDDVPAGCANESPLGSTFGPATGRQREPLHMRCPFPKSAPQRTAKWRAQRKADRQVPTRHLYHKRKCRPSKKSNSRNRISN